MVSTVGLLLEGSLPIENEKPRVTTHRVADFKHSPLSSVMSLVKTNKKPKLSPQVNRQKRHGLQTGFKLQVQRATVLYFLDMPFLNQIIILLVRFWITCLHTEEVIHHLIPACQTSGTSKQCWTEALQDWTLTLLNSRRKNVG